MNYKLRENNLVAVFGDWHGNGQWAEKVLNRVGQMGVRKGVQVGDFGIFPGIETVRYLDQVNTACRKWGITLYTLRGNHDSNYWEHLLASEFSVSDIRTGGVYVRSHIVLLPRTGHFFLGERRCAVAGGAVSIDKRYRVPGQSWWPEEELTDREVDEFPERQVDILFTHDCSTRTPWGQRLKPDNDSHIHRQRIDRVLQKATPKVHFHGHMHEWYDWQNPLSPSGQGQWTQTYGLNMDGTSKSTGILDLDTLFFRLVI